MYVNQLATLAVWKASPKVAVVWDASVEELGVDLNRDTTAGPGWVDWSFISQTFQVVAWEVSLV